MATIDQRIVEMRFDNDQFEAGVSQSLSTLDKLKNALKFDKAETGLEGLSSSLDDLDMSGISSACDSISDKFSVFGTIGDQVIRRLTDSVISLGKSLLNNINAPLEQIKTGGWSRALNIDNAKFSLEGLDIAWSSVNKDLQYAVNQTAYGLDAAATAAASLAASGINISDDITLTVDKIDELNTAWEGMSASELMASGHLDQMSVALRAISGVASITNSSYTDIANVFTRVAGQGRVMATDLNSLAARGMNAAATLAEALGVTESEVREMVSKGEVDFQTFANAMYDAFADQAVKANNTFTGSLANMKAALSKIGADFYQPFLEEVPALFNAIRLAINNLRTNLSPFIEDLNMVTKSAIEFGTAFFQVFQKVEDGGKGSEFLLYVTKALREAFYSLLLILTPIKNAFLDTFDIFNSGSWGDLGKAIYAIVEALSPSETVVKALYYAFRALFTIIKTGAKVAVTAIRAIYALLNPILNLIDALAGAALNFVAALTGSSISGIAKALGSVKSVIEDIYYIFIGLIKIGIDKLASKIRSFDFGPIVRSIKNVVNGFGEWLSQFPVINKLIEGFKNIIHSASSPLEAFLGVIILIGLKIKDLIITFKNLPIVKDSIKAIQKIASSFGSSFKNLGTNTVKAIINAFGKLKTLRLSDIGAAFTSLGERIKKFFSMLTSGQGFIKSFGLAFHGLYTTISNVVEKIKSLFSNIFPKKQAKEIETVTKMVNLSTGNLIQTDAVKKTNSFADALSKIGSAIKGFLSNISATQVVAISFGLILVSMAYNLTVLTKAVTSFIKPVGQALNFINQVKLTTTRLKQSLIKSAKIIEFAGAIIILTKALKEIASIPADRLKASGIALGILVGVFTVIVGAMTGLQVALEKFNHGNASAKIATSMLMMSSALLVVVGALKLLEKVNVNASTVAKIAAASAIMVTLGFLAAVLGKYAPGQIKNATASAISMLALAAALALICTSLKQLQQLSSDQILAAVKGLIPVMVAMALLSQFMKGIGVGSAVGLIAFVLLFDKIMPKLVELGQYLPALDDVIAFCNKYKLAIVGLAALFALTSKFGNGFKNVGKSVLYISIGLYALSKVVKVLGSFGSGELKRGVLAVAGLIACIAALEALSALCKGDEFKKFSKGMLMITASMYLLTGLVAILANLNTKDIIKGEAALAALVAMVAAMEFVSKYANGKAIGVVITTVIAIGVMVGYLAVLAGMSWGEIKKGLIALTGVFGVLAAAFAIIAAVSKYLLSASSLLPAIALVGAIIVAVWALTEGLTQLMNFQWDQLVGAATSMAIALLSVVGAVSILSVLSGVLGAGNIVAGLGMMIIIIAALMAVLAAIGAIKKYTGYQELVDGAIDMVVEHLTRCVDGLGQVFDAINAMPTVGTGLRDSVINLAEAILILGAAEIAAGVENSLAWLTGGKIGFFEILVELGYYLQEFADSISGLTEEDIEHISLAAEAVAAICSVDVPNTGGLLGLIVGNNDLDDFGETLPTFGEGLTAFCKSIKDITKSDIEKIETVAEATAALVEIASEIENSGGLLSVLVGDNDLGTFGDSLASYGKSLTKFCKSIKEITSDDVEKVATVTLVTQKLIDMANSIDGNIGGVVSLFTGDNDLATFAGTLTPYVIKLGAFMVAANAVDLANTDKVDDIINVTQQLIRIANAVPDNFKSGILGNVAKLFVGDQSLGAFAKTLIPYINEIQRFFNKLAEVDEGSIDVAKVDSLVTVTEKLNSLAQKLDTIGGLKTIWSGKNDLGTFGKSLAKYAEGINAFSAASNGIDYTTISDRLTTLTEITVKLNSLSQELDTIGGVSKWWDGKKDLGTFGNSLGKYATGLASFFRTLDGIPDDANTKVLSLITVTKNIQRLCDDLNNLTIPTVDGSALEKYVKSIGKISQTEIGNAFNDTSKVSSSINKFINSITASLNASQTKIKYAGKALGAAVISGFKGNDFTTAGQYAAVGLVRGANKGVSSAKAAGSNLGKSLLNGLNTALDIHSPSKEGEKSGGFFGSGIINGVVNKAKDVYNSGKETGSKLINGFSDGSSGTSQVLYEKLFGPLKEIKEEAENTVSSITGGSGSTGLDSALDSVTDSATDTSKALSSTSSAASSAAKSTSELAEEQKALAKYTAYSNAVINTFANAYGGALELLGESSAIDTASAAFETLFNKIYEESSDASDSVSDSTEEATDKVLEMKKAFNEAFESIASTVEDSIDVFSEFDKGLDSVVKPEKLIKNYQSQVDGIKSFYKNLDTLALKGFSDDIIADLIEEGTSAYPKVISMLKATSDQVEELNKAWESKEALGYEAAISAMTARMTAIQMESFKKTVAARKAEKESLNDAQKAYQEYAELANKAYEDNKDIATELQDENSDLAKSYKTLTEAMDKAGLTSEDLQKAMESGEGFEEQDKAINDLNESLDAYRELAKKAAEEGIDIAEESIDNTTELGKAYEALMTKVEAAGFTVENLYSVMANDSSFVNQTDYVEGIINVYTKCEEIMSEFSTVGEGIFDNVQSQMEGMITYFDECETEFDMTAADIRQNLQDQLKLMTDYNSNMMQIAKMGEYGGKLIAEYGDKITAEVANALVQGGSSLVEETYNTFKTLEAMPYQNAEGVKNAWMQYGTVGGLGYNDALNQSINAQQILATMGIAGQNVGQGLANGMSASTGLVTTQAATMAQALVNQIHTSLDEHSPSRITTNSGQNIDQGLINGMQNYRGQVINTASLMCTSLISETRSKLNQSTFAEIGRNVGSGLASGINSGSSSAISAAVSMAKSALQAAKNALGIHSPSREFAFVGKMSDAGFASGFEDNASLVENAVTDTMKSALATACDLLSSDMDVNPTITPIIDLSDAQNGAELLSSMFTGQSFGFTTNAELGHITTNAERMNNMLGSLNAGNTATYGDTNLYIYGSQGQNVNQLADIVINRLNNEYARRKAAWS